MRKEEDLYREWAQTKRPYTMEAILDEMEGVIHKAVTKYSGGHIPGTSLHIKARQLAAEAVKTYKPESGAKLSTWVTTYLEKLNRFYSQNNILHISEDMFNTKNRYYNQKNSLIMELDRDPTVSELADSMGVPEKKILNMEKVFSPHYNDSVINTNKYVGTDSLTEDDLVYAVRQLTEYEQRMFKMKTGWPSGKPETLAYISSKTGKSKATLSRELEAVADKIKYILGV